MNYPEFIMLAILVGGVFFLVGHAVGWHEGWNAAERLNGEIYGRKK